MKIGPRKPRRSTGGNAGDFLRHAVKAAVRDKFGIAGEQLVDVFGDFVQQYVDQKPEEPWWQLQDKCPGLTCKSLGVQLYQSHNGFVQCLRCRVIYKRPSLGYVPQTHDRTRDFNRERQQPRPQQQRRQAPPIFVDPQQAKIRKAYALLGLERGVSQDEIKRRRRELAMRYHSDVSGADGKKMAEINAAVDLLLETSK